LDSRTPLPRDVYKKDTLMAKELKESQKECGAIRAEVGNHQGNTLGFIH